MKCMYPLERQIQWPDSFKELGEVGNSKSQSTCQPTRRLAILSPMGRDSTGRHGGITSVVSALANLMPKEDVGVDLLLYAPAAGEDAVHRRCPNACVINLGRRNKAATLLALRRYLRQFRPDAFLAAGQRANALASLVQRFLNPSIPIWGSVHNSLSQGLDRASFPKHV